MKKLSQALLSEAQQDAITTLYESNGLMMYGKMGAGKTIIALIALSELLRDGELSRILIFAPLKVCNSVWKQESEKWEGLDHLSVGIATGSAKNREEVIECKRHNIVVINFENIPWFFDTYGKDHGFDGLLIDELTKLKSVGGKQFKKLRPRLPTFQWRAGLTGTPVGENFQSLFSMMMVIDCGIRLGTRKSIFLTKYFYPTDYEQRNWALRPGGANAIMELIKDIVYTIPDYRHELPLLNIEHVPVTLPDSARDVYTTLAKKRVYLDIAAESAAVLQGKLLQVASGFLYRDDDKPALVLHNEKINQCLKLLKNSDRNTVIVYWFKEDLSRLRKALPDAVAINDNPHVIQDWQKGKIKHLLLHPLSGGHGLQLELGGSDMIFLTPLWSNDLTEQTIARIWRKGQQSDVNVQVIESVNTVDQLVIERVAGKKAFDALFNEHIKGV